ncbi:MAG: flagellar hook assembly protein FlgD [Geminicoccaceae bacterium]|nr:flagellar hook assembly protein FlgD [Geminicoccaceae bacterium]
MPTVASPPAASLPVVNDTRRARDRLTADFATFLELLTTQLRNQDPLSPMDTERFTSQLVQFSIVEQALRTNERLERLVNLVRTGTAASALALVGRPILVDGSRMRVDEQGGATIYTLDRPAASVTVRIFDDSGRLVLATAGPAAAGANRFVWDGRLLDGTRVEPGTYRVAVSALDAGGRPIDVRFERTTTLEGLETRGKDLVLVADGIALPPEAIRPAPSTS